MESSTESNEEEEENEDAIDTKEVSSEMQNENGIEEHADESQDSIKEIREGGRSRKRTKPNYLYTILFASDYLYFFLM